MSRRHVGSLCCLLAALLAVIAFLRAGPEAAAQQQQQETQEARIARLIRTLGDDEFDVREKAEQELRQLGEVAREALTAAKADRDPEIRRRAAKAVLALDEAKSPKESEAWRLIEQARKQPKKVDVKRPEEPQPQPKVDAPPDPKRIAKLIGQLGDEEMTKRAGAEAELKRIGEPALDALLKARGREDLEVRRRVERLLVPACEAKAERLLADLAGKQLERREAATKELTKLMREDAERFQQEAALKILTTASSNHRSAEVKQQVGKILESHQPVRIVKLIEQLGDDRFAVREAAERQLSLIGKPALGALKAALRNPDLEIRNRCQKLLQRLEEAR